MLFRDVNGGCEGVGEEMGCCQVKCGQENKWCAVCGCNSTLEQQSRNVPSLNVTVAPAEPAKQNSVIMMDSSRHRTRHKLKKLDITG